MFDQPVFADRIHPLQNDQDRPAVLCVKLVLQIAHFRDSPVQQLLRVFLGVNMRRARRIKILQPEFLPMIYAVWIGQLAGPAHGSTSSEVLMPTIAPASPATPRQTDVERHAKSHLSQRRSAGQT